ncbi:MAG: 16S rRNA (guanine(527)-N(7))-methyltransferase RsmG [Polyangiaceae bacterium]
MGLRPLGSAWLDPLQRATEIWQRDTGLEAPSRDLLASFVPFLDKVATWTQRVDLTAARDTASLVELYLTDALCLAALLEHDAGSVVDVGSGGGAPGLSLALLRPELELTLVEPRAKRVSFLRTTASQLELERVTVVRGRSDALPDCSYDVAMSRATFAPADWLSEGARLSRRSVWVFLASGDVPTAPNFRVERDLEYRLPFSGARRRLLCFAREESRPCTEQGDRR